MQAEITASRPTYPKQKYLLHLQRGLKHRPLLGNPRGLQKAEVLLTAASAAIRR